MKKSFYFLFMVIVPLLGEAQNYFTNSNLAYLPVSPDRIAFNRKTEGSPFLLKRFSNATIYLEHNKVISDIPANLDFENNEILVLDEKRKLYAISAPVYRVVFEDPETGLERTILSGLPGIEKQTEKSYYELLVPGSLNLLKSITLYWSDSRAYHEAATTRKYEQVTSYYIYNDTRGMIRLPKTIQDIAATIHPAEADKLTKFIQDHQLNLKNEVDLIKLIEHHNSAH
jgi:hypothetical protein